MMNVVVNIEENSQEANVMAALKSMGLWATPLLSVEGFVQGFRLEAHSQKVSLQDIRAIAGVKEVWAPSSPHPLVDARAGANKLDRAGIHAGAKGRGNAPVLLAGPCSVESAVQIDSVAAMVKQVGGSFLRGGAFKPRTSPYAFSGYGVQALQWLREAANKYGLGVVTEVTSERQVGTVTEYADVLQVGSRNMQNFALLEATGKAHKPVLLKRGMAANIQEWLLAGEYLLKAGASDVWFCERGIMGFDNQTRNLLDLGAVALLKHVYGVTVLVDPSHAAGRRDLLLPLSKAAIAAGADGIIVETHMDAGQAKSDGPQAANMQELQNIAQALCLSSGDAQPVMPAGVEFQAPAVGMSTPSPKYQVS